MIINPMVYGGGEQAFAFILATYPSGSTCTCPNSFGSRQIAATQKIFYIRSGVVPFNCTVSITDGTQTKTATVTITAEGQSTSVTLSYEIIVYNYGVTDPACGAWVKTQISGSSSFQEKTDHLYYNQGAKSGASAIIATGNTIDVTNYSTLYAIVEYTQIKYIANIGISDENGTSNYDAFTSIKSYPASTVSTLSLDVSSFSGLRYVKVNASAETTALKIYKIWLV